MIDYGFKGKVAVVTGAGGGGFGTGICLMFAQEGANVICNDIDHTWADKLAKEVNDLGAKGIATYADVTKFEDCQKMADTALKQFGRIDYLVTVPALTVAGPFVESKPEIWRKTIEITYFGVLGSVKAVLPSMMEHKSGSIIMISSDAGKVGEANMAVYGGAKAAINHLAKCLVQEISRYNIRINSVSPGTAKTPMAVSSGWLTPEREAKIAKIFPMGRLTEVSDVVDCVAFLASDKAKFITGQVVSVSGGYT